MKYIKIWDDKADITRFKIIEDRQDLVETYDDEADYYKLVPVKVSDVIDILEDLK